MGDDYETFGHKLGLRAQELKDLKERELQRYRQQQQNLMKQSYASLGAQNLTTSTASMFNTFGSSTTWHNTTTSLFGQASYPPQIDRLEKLEPGWFYVRWRKRDDHEAEAWAVPIIALAVISGRVEYQLAGANVQAQSEVRPETFLGIVNPKETYDHAFWCEKARAAFYDYHAAEVAAKLLKSAAQGGKAA